MFIIRGLIHKHELEFESCYICTGRSDKNIIYFIFISTMPNISPYMLAKIFDMLIDVFELVILYTFFLLSVYFWKNESMAI